MTDDDRTNADYGRMIREMLLRDHPLEAKQTRDLPDIDIESLQTDHSIETDAQEQLLQTLSQRREYELRGAWRAGYDYVHVYRRRVPVQPLGREGIDTALASPEHFEPSNNPDPPIGPGEYIYTYDIASVPDDAIRQAIRGDHD